MAIVINGSTNVIGGVAVGGLPDGIVDTDMLAASAVTAAKSSGLATTNGITHASSWYLTSGFTGSVDPVTALSTYASAGAGTIGSAMTINSGIFTFPTTGIWWIAVDTGFHIDGDSRYNRARIQTTTNNNTYAGAISSYCFIDDEGYSGHGYQSMHTNHLFDVEDTSTHKCRIEVEVQNSSVNTWNMKVLFVRYGDT